MGHGLARRLRRGLQRSIVGHEVKHLRRELARQAEGRPVPSTLLGRVRYYVIEETMAFGAQIRNLWKDFTRPERPIPIDEVLKMGNDRRLTDPEALLPDLRAAGGVRAILNLPKRRVGPYEIVWANYRKTSTFLAKTPWQQEADETGVRNLNFPIGPNDFYFGKDPTDWEIAKVTELQLGEKRWTVRLNRGPFSRYHMMIVPNHRENQYFRDSDARAVIDFLERETEDSYTTVAYNSLFSAASQNSKHFHVVFDRVSAFNRGTRWIGRSGDVRIGLLLRGSAWWVGVLGWLGLSRWLRDFPGGVIRLQSNNPQALEASFQQTIHRLHSQSIPYSYAARKGDILIVPIRNSLNDRLKDKKGLDLILPFIVLYEEIFKTMTRQDVDEAIAYACFTPAEAETFLEMLGNNGGSSHSMR